MFTKESSNWENITQNTIFHLPVKPFFFFFKSPNFPSVLAGHSNGMLELEIHSYSHPGAASPRSTCYYAVMLVDMGHLLFRAGELFFDHCVIIPLPTDAENQEEPEKHSVPLVIHN